MPLGMDSESSLVGNCHAFRWDYADATSGNSCRRMRADKRDGGNRGGRS